MLNHPSPSLRPQIPFVALVPYLIMTFSLPWCILSFFIFLPALTTELFGELTGQHPLFYLAVYAPAISALIMVPHYAGIDGLRSFVARLLLWRCSFAWYAFIIFGIPFLFFGGAVLKGVHLTDSFADSSFQVLFTALSLALIKGPIEEFGWRGFFLPLLQRKLAPVWAGLILGLVWGFWHLPAFLLSGTQQGAWSFTPFLVGTVAISLILTPLFNASRGSILLPFLIHFQLINPLWPDAQPYDTIFFVAAAAFIVWFNRKTMFIKEGAVIDVIPKEGGEING